jgi:hypothetical protein
MDTPKTAIGRRPLARITQRISLVLAITVGLAVLFENSFYERVLEWGNAEILYFIGIPAFIGIIAFGVRDHATDSLRLAVPWAAVALLLVLVVGLRAVGDAEQLRSHNCWEIEGPSLGTGTWEECAVGSVPREWASSESSEGRYCEYFDLIEQDDPSLYVDLERSTTNVFRCE